MRHDFLPQGDADNITANARLADVASFWKAPYRGRYVPLTYTVWAGLSRVAPRDGQPNPAVFHAANVALHALGAVLALWLLLALRGPQAPAWTAVVGALLFAWHPAQTEAVAWVSGLKDVLSTSLMLATMVCFVHGWGVLATLCFTLAVLSKTTAVAVIGMLAAIALLRRRREYPVALLALWLGLALPLVVLTARQPDNVPSLALGLGDRMRLATDSLDVYARRLLLAPAESLAYGRSPAEALDGWARERWLLPAVLLLLAIAARRRIWFLALGIFVAALVPVLGLIPLRALEMSTIADRYAYPATLAVALGAAYLAARLRPRLAAVASIALLAFCVYRTLPQIGQWKNAQTAARLGTARPHAHG